MFFDKLKKKGLYEKFLENPTLVKIFIKKLNKDFFLKDQRIKFINKQFFNSLAAF